MQFHGLEASFPVGRKGEDVAADRFGEAEALKLLGPARRPGDASQTGGAGGAAHPSAGSPSCKHGPGSVLSTPTQACRRRLRGAVVIASIMPTNAKMKSA